jgi:hypothetical protein
MTTSKTLKLAERINSKLTGKPMIKAKSPMEVAEGLVSKAAGTRTKLSRPQLAKRLEKIKEKYQEYYQNLNDLKSKRDVLDSRIAEVDSKFKLYRSEMMKLTEQMRAMTLSGSKAVIQENEDISYVKDGLEYHLDIDATGDVSSMPMKEYKKLMKDLAKKQEKEEKEELTEEDVDGIVEVEGEEELTDEDIEGVLDKDDDDDVAIGDYYKNKK